MLAPGGEGDDKAPKVHVHCILQRVDGLFQLAEFYETLGGWVMGLGQEVVQDDGRLGGTRGAEPIPAISRNKKAARIKITIFHSNV